jgi:transaldolase
MPVGLGRASKERIIMPTHQHIGPANTRMAALHAAGQSVWQDDLSRDMLQDGSLQRRIEVGIRGLTTNPTIMERAISAGSTYDQTIASLLVHGNTDHEVVESLVVEDIQAAADLFRPIYDSSGGADGFVSIEVSPAAATDPAAMRAEAIRLWAGVDRPNVLIKVPGTVQSIAVIEDLLTDGINVNITLLFSVDRYERVARAYIRALERRQTLGCPVDRIASVASFFVSRVNVLVDQLLDARLARASTSDEQQRLTALKQRAGIANARLAYARFREVFSGVSWEALQVAGARVQRPLWASTSAKGPDYPDTFYVDQLIGPDTVTTMPRATLDAFLDHGVVGRTVDQGLDNAHRAVRELAAIGIDLDSVGEQLEAEGATIFARSFDALLDRVAGIRRDLPHAIEPLTH